ncbi:LysR family transcriptional regulator [Mesorhizobium sp. NBSH29]|uniref:LysR substrate-binding domain-containing protein n=1 Tax=Mesorhizobium sp. NBSH29 TaxID=2654249 RepID=UPI001896918F|nr:LysR substrate-binding domain-containing protein [Mesorhizobium sp. NBSH29]QPC85311.1 LysR family transcriptional regulator [Mesorhizobium sp. NBSH29]
MRNLNRVQLNGLRALEAAGRLGSLQRAADELGVSPGAVSQQIIKTERQLATAVFDRTPSGLRATRAGATLLTRLTGAFRELDHAVASVAEQEDTTLTISVAPVFASKWLVPRLASFRKHHPEFRVRIDATTELVDPDRSDIDLCIRVGLDNWPKVKAGFLLPQEVFPVCAPDLAEKLENPSDLANLPIIRDANSNLSWNIWLKPFGLSDTILGLGDTFTDASLCLDAAISGQGVMLAWQTLAFDALRSGLLVAPFRERVASGYGYYIITSATRREPPKVARFRAWLKEEIAASVVDGDAIRQ